MELVHRFYLKRRTIPSLIVVSIIHGLFHGFTVIHCIYIEMAIFNPPLLFIYQNWTVRILFFIQYLIFVKLKLERVSYKWAKKGFEVYSHNYFWSSSSDDESNWCFFFTFCFSFGDLGSLVSPFGPLLSHLRISIAKRIFLWVLQENRKIEQLRRK